MFVYAFVEVSASLPDVACWAVLTLVLLYDGGRLFYCDFVFVLGHVMCFVGFVGEVFSDLLMMLIFVRTSLSASEIKGTGQKIDFLVLCVTSLG